MTTTAARNDLPREVIDHILSLKGKTLADLPLELVELILSFTDPITVSHFSCTCTLYFSLVYDSEHQNLWRTLFLDDYDDPSFCINAVGIPVLAPGQQFDWLGEVRRRERAYTVINNFHFRNDDELLEVLNTLIRMASEIPPASPEYTTDKISRNLVCLVAYRRLGLFLEFLHNRNRMVSGRLPPEVNQARAKLHVMLGLTGADFLPERRVLSRATVYDMSLYDEKNNWGPFLPGPSREVNWTHIRMVQHVMQLHVIRAAEEFVGGPEVMTMLPYCQAQLVQDASKEDWAGVQGTWSCMFCFVDHRDLLGSLFSSL